VFLRSSDCRRTSADPEIGYGVLGMAFFCLPAVGLRAYAQRLDERHRAGTEVPAAVQTAGAP
jgi:hypothetical protein